MSEQMMKQLYDLLEQGRISRRDFLKHVAALGVTASIIPTIKPHLVNAATPKKGGRFRAGLTGGSSTDSLDPATITDYMVICIDRQIRNNLVEIDPKFNPIPELAESWEATTDATQWTFKLRQGIEFHNGKVFDSKDVIYSINRHREKDSKSGAQSLLAPIKDIKSDGKHDVIFTLEKGNADFPTVLADYHLAIVPDGTKGAEFEKGVGTGGYILQDWEPGVRAFTKRNPNYWKEGRANFDEVETIGIADTNARTNALMTDQIDYMNNCELRTVNRLEGKQNIEVLKYTGLFHFTMPMHTNKAPYNNNDVRMALKYAIDREALLKLVLNGYGRIGNDHPIAPVQQFHADNLPQRDYDPDKAKYHLKKAGMESHIFKLHTADFNHFSDLAILYKEHAAKAGVNIEVVKEPTDGYWSNVWMKKPFCSCSWSLGTTEDIMFSTAYAADAAWNDTFWKHERFNKLLIEARAELNNTKRAAMYAEMQNIVRDEGGAIIPLFKDYIEAASSRVGHGVLSGSLALDGGKCAERWWFKS